MQIATTAKVLPLISVTTRLKGAGAVFPLLVLRDQMEKCVQMVYVYAPMSTTSAAFAGAAFAADLLVKRLRFGRELSTIPLDSRRMCGSFRSRPDRRSDATTAAPSSRAT